MENYDLIVIGAGPGGYVAAIRAAQLGLNVACIEKGITLGGTCLNVGCIPSKALLQSSELYHQSKNELADHGIGIQKVELDFQKMMARKEGIVKKLTGGVSGLFKKNKIDSIVGLAQVHQDLSVTVKTGKTNKKLIAKNIIIATGSSPIELPNLPLDHKKIIDSTDALSLKSIPKTMAIIGGGYIGLEMGSVYSRLGSSVTIIEAMDRIVPQMDLELGKAYHRVLQKQGLEFLLGTKVEKAKTDPKGVTLTMGEKKTLKVDVVLVAVGRKPCTEGLGLEKAGIKVDDRGQISVNEHYQTSVPGIYAIGDVIRGPMLAHKASEEGVVCVEKIMGQKSHVHYQTIPSVVYTWPEVASVGFTEEQVKEKSLNYKKFKFPFLASGRAQALGCTDGFVKLIADKKTDEILGAHLMGPNASELVAELVLAMEYKASAEDIARTIHAHPTLSEAIKEAALGLGDGTINL